MAAASTSRSFPPADLPGATFRIPQLCAFVLRADGRFSDVQEFEKPNDRRALDLMNRAARAVMDEFEEIVLAFGESDEFS